MDAVVVTYMERLLYVCTYVEFYDVPAVLSPFAILSVALFQKYLAVLEGPL